ncbi:hypothetical protein MMC34_004753 [Xylographa carneopallida]|nr:hypothetical protein [Xylographa carneopallida]
MDHKDFANSHKNHAHSPAASSQTQNTLLASIEDDFSDSEPHSHHSSGPDDTVFDNPTHHESHHSSPHTSDDDISSLAASSRVPSYSATAHRPSSPYTPLKTIFPFRHPSSVRAVQLETTPPPFTVPPSSQRQQELRTQDSRFNTPTRNSTPRSNRSVRSPSRMSVARKEKVRKEHPLVLLHVTVLPIGMPYSREIMETALPVHVLEGWKLLGEKITATVQERGILIPHPREDYDLLEERLLESLELKVPRILKCGHFHLEEGEVEEEDDESETDEDICEDCGRRLRDGRKGSGTGAKRWDVKVYAANGLMRAGAWGAAWREMERVDVEVEPWLEEGLRRRLEALREEEELRSMNEPAHDVHANPEPVHGVGNIDAERIREIYGEDAQAYVDGHVESPKVQRQNFSRHRHKSRDVELWVLLRNYLRLVMRDRKNVVIALLSIMVLFLSVSRTAVAGTVDSSMQLVPNTLVAGFASAKGVAESAGECVVSRLETIASAAVPTKAITAVEPPVTVTVERELREVGQEYAETVVEPMVD